MHDHRAVAREAGEREREDSFTVNFRESEVFLSRGAWKLASGLEHEISKKRPQTLILVPCSSRHFRWKGSARNIKIGKSRRH